MTTREKFERKLEALKARYEAVCEEMLDTIETLEGERDLAIEERDELQGRLDEIEAEAAA